MMEMMEESKGCSEKEEEEEEEDHILVRDERFSHQDAAAINFNSKLDLMDLSLGNKDMDEATGFIHGGGGSGSCSTSAIGASALSGCSHDLIEKEHMFDKVVTPSDVGKLNRLVIPKQHAEKYFPLDSSSNEKGLLLNFEDRNGKSWRFRYSYWNSSQSYVMTKGWSRFVKEKKLDAGDVVSFQRGIGDLHKHRLYIDWRRRPDHHHHASDHHTTGLISPLLISNQTPFPQYSIRWSGRLYSLPQPLSMSRQHHERMQHQMNYNFHPYYHHQQQQQQLNHLRDPYGSGHLHFNEVYFSSPASTSLQNRAVRQDGGGTPMVIDSVPVGHHSGKAAAKKLRLFGVNMEYSPSPDEDPRSCHILSSTVLPPQVNATMAIHSVPPPHLPSSSLSPLHLRLPHGAAIPSYSQARFQEKGESSSPFDLDPSIPYFR